jgi:AcrR family transcriptional regulator
MPKHSTTLDTNASSDELIKDEMSDKIISAAEKIATSSGPEALTVRKILQHLAITNRVFYNRFHNISEVLDIVYQNTIQKIRDTIPTEFDPDKDFFEQVIDFVANTLVISYRAKNHFNYYVFENDSVSDYNYRWWMQKIREIIEYAKEKRYIQNVDSEVMSYSIWCFCRGYNADAVGRGLPMNEAIKNFKYSFAFLLNGLRTQEA